MASVDVDRQLEHCLRELRLSAMRGCHEAIAHTAMQESWSY